MYYIRYKQVSQFIHLGFSVNHDTTTIQVSCEWGAGGDMGGESIRSTRYPGGDGFRLVSTVCGAAIIRIGPYELAHDFMYTEQFVLAWRAATDDTSSCRLPQLVSPQHRQLKVNKKELKSWHSPWYYIDTVTHSMWDSSYIARWYRLISSVWHWHRYSGYVEDYLSLSISTDHLRLSLTMVQVVR